MSSQLALRIGVVLSGTVIAEHVLRDRRAFSIGQSTRATVSIPVPDLPRSLDLLTLVDGGIRVRLPAGAEARVSVGDTLLTRAELDARGSRAGGATTVVVPSDAHGRIELGSVRVLFQGVTLPAAVAPAKLPRALQATLGDRVDRRLAAFVAASVLAHVALMSAASLNDPPQEQSTARRATEQYADETIAIIDADDPLLAQPEPTELADEPAEPAPGAQTPSKPGPSNEPKPAPRPGKPAEPGSLTDPSDDATRFADDLFSSDAGGLRPGELTGRKPGSDLGKQLDEIAASGANTSIGNGTQVATRDREGVRPGTAQEPLVNGSGPVIHTPGKEPETVPPGRIRPVPPKNPPGGPDVDSIIRKISTTYVGGLQRCYKKALAGDAKLAGKIILTFTVTDRGKLSDGRAAGVDDTLADCVEGLMTSWTFTPVVDADGDATDVDLKLPLQLTPT